MYNAHLCIEQRWSKTLKLFITLLLFSINYLSAQTPQQVELKKARRGQTFYTKYSFFYEMNRHYTTNYRRGLLIPINTPVTFLASWDDRIFIKLPDNKTIFLYNVQNYSGEKISGIFKRTFSASPVDISNFTEDQQKAINSGIVKVGMSRAAVLAALGYPPKHRTPSLDCDNWRYWSSRFGSFVVSFENDTVVYIEN